MRTPEDVARERVGECDVRVTLHVTEKVSHAIEATVPEGLLEDMRQDDVDTRDVQAVTTWLAGNLDTDDALILEGFRGAAECAVTERILEGVSPPLLK